MVDSDDLECEVLGATQTAIQQAPIEKVKFEPSASSLQIADGTIGTIQGESAGKLHPLILRDVLDPRMLLTSASFFWLR